MTRAVCEIGKNDEACKGCRQAVKGCYWNNRNRLGKVFRARPTKRVKTNNQVSDEEDADTSSKPPYSS